MSNNEKSLNKGNNETEGKYMNLNKKQYYLASVDENVDMLQKKQINDLTNILIIFIPYISDIYIFNSKKTIRYFIISI